MLIDFLTVGSVIINRGVYSRHMTWTRVKLDSFRLDKLLKIVKKIIIWLVLAWHFTRDLTENIIKHITPLIIKIIL